MKSFIQFHNNLITEASARTSATSEIASDDKGKLHELLLAKHLHPKGQLPEHHRSLSENPDYAGTPQQVHDKLKDKIGSAAYNEINAHAKGTAAAVVEHMKKHGHLGPGESIGNVHWTSNADTAKKSGDHEKTTGIRDPNSNADLIATKHKGGKPTGFVGVSAKHGFGKSPNFRNAGLASLEGHSGHTAGKFSDIMHEHNKRMEGLGYTGTAKVRHVKHKKDVLAAASGDKEAASRVNAAEESSKAARQQIAKHYSEGMSKLSDSQLREHIKSQVSPSTAIPHVIAHSHISASGDVNPIVHNAESAADEHLNKFKDLHIDHKPGISSTVYGTHKKTGKLTRVATTVIKASSGPHKGAAGTFLLK